MSIQNSPNEPMALADSHCHLDFPDFDDDRDSVIGRAVRQGIRLKIVPATTRDSWQRVQAICGRHDSLVPAYGLHPLFMDIHASEDACALESWLKAHPETCGIGECGLDFSRNSDAGQSGSVEKAAQMALFEPQLELARSFQLPVIIHALKAVEDVILAVRRAGVHSGMIHSYNGSLQQAHRLMDLGFRFSFGGAITYPRATRLRKLVTELPLDALLLETDSPDQPPVQATSQRNEPENLLQVFETVCELRSESRTEIAETTYRNTCELFRQGRPSDLQSTPELHP